MKFYEIQKIRQILIRIIRWRKNFAFSRNLHFILKFKEILFFYYEFSKLLFFCSKEKAELFIVEYLNGMNLLTFRHSFTHG